MGATNCEELKPMQPLHNRLLRRHRTCSTGYCGQLCLFYTTKDFRVPRLSISPNNSLWHGTCDSSTGLSQTTFWQHNGCKILYPHEITHEIDQSESNNDEIVGIRPHRLRGRAQRIAPHAFAAQLDRDTPSASPGMVVTATAHPRHLADQVVDVFEAQPHLEPLRVFLVQMGCGWACTRCHSPERTGACWTRGLGYKQAELS